MKLLLHHFTRDPSVHVFTHEYFHVTDEGENRHYASVCQLSLRQLQIKARFTVQLTYATHATYAVQRT